MGLEIQVNTHVIIYSVKSPKKLGFCNENLFLSDFEKKRSHSVHFWLKLNDFFGFYLLTKFLGCSIIL